MDSTSPYLRKEPRSLIDARTDIATRIDELRAIEGVSPQMHSYCTERITRLQNTLRDIDALIADQKAEAGA